MKRSAFPLLLALCLYALPAPAWDYGPGEVISVETAIICRPFVPGEGSGSIGEYPFYLLDFVGYCSPDALDDFLENFGVAPMHCFTVTVINIRRPDGTIDHVVIASGLVMGLDHAIIALIEQVGLGPALAQIGGMPGYEGIRACERTQVQGFRDDVTQTDIVDAVVDNANNATNLLPIYGLPDCQGQANGGYCQVNAALEPLVETRPGLLCANRSTTIADCRSCCERSLDECTRACWTVECIESCFSRHQGCVGQCLDNLGQ